MTQPIEIIVRTYECDSYKHVNNAVYLNYLEYARMQFLQNIGFDYNGILAAGYYLYIAHLDIYYKASAVVDDKLFLEVKPLKLKKISGEFKQAICKADGTVCVEATVTWACVAAINGRPTKLPDEFVVDGLRPENKTIVLKQENRQCCQPRICCT